MDERDTTATIDRALAHGAVAATDPFERELEQLALALAAEAPAADPAFASRLDERVQASFPREHKRIRVPALRGIAARLTAKRPLTALSAVASLLIALVVAVNLIGGDDRATTLGQSGGVDVGEPTPDSQTGESASDSAGSTAAPEPKTFDFARPAIVDRRSAQRSALAPPGADVQRLPRRGFAPGVRDRRIERSATLALAAPDDRLDRVATAIAAVTERHRGFVLTSSLATGDGGATTGGEFELRIPAARLDRALADLAELGQVRSRTTAGDDVTSAFVTTGDRLQAAHAERRGLLARLESAETDVEAESLRLQLDANAGEINRLQGRLRMLRLRTDYATVAVTLESRDDDAVAPGDGIGGALDDALDSVGDALELAIRALGIALPLALLAAALALAARTVKRRRRESALS
jgi:hypothetical protein